MESKGKRGIRVLFAAGLITFLVLNAQNTIQNIQKQGIRPEINYRQTIKIGVSLYGLENQETLLFVEGLLEESKRLGLDVEVYKGNYDSLEQIEHIEQMIDNHVDGIILNPQDETEAAVCADKAIEAGVPLIAANVNVKHTGVSCYIGTDDFQSGSMAMEYIAKKIGGEGNVAILEETKGKSSRQKWMEGIKKVLERYPEIRVVSCKSANGFRMEAEAVASRWLEVFEKLDAIVAENDEMALGAFNAVRSYEKDIRIAGIGGTKEAVEEVKKGGMDITIYQSYYEQGCKAMQIMLGIITGEKIEKEYLIPLKSVTIENVKEFEENYNGINW